MNKVYAYGRTYYYYGTYIKYQDVKRTVERIRENGNKTFVRKIIKGIIFPVTNYQLFVTKR